MNSIVASVEVKNTTSERTGVAIKITREGFDDVIIPPEQKFIFLITDVKSNTFAISETEHLRIEDELNK